MGSKGGPAAPSADEQRETMRRHWEDYQKWGLDARTSRDKQLSGMRAKMSAGGVKEGSEQWKTNLKRIETGYKGDIKGIKSGVTRKTMEDWLTAQGEGGHFEVERGAYTLSERRKGETEDAYGARVLEERSIATAKIKSMSVEDYMASEFGTIETAAPTAKEAARTRAQEAGAGGSTAKRTASAAASTTGSPWW